MDGEACGIVDPHWDDRRWVYIQGDAGKWRGSDEPGIKHHCPVCRKSSLKASRYCVRCDDCGNEDRAAKHGFPIDSKRNPGWWDGIASQPTRYAPSGLRGGR